MAKRAYKLWILKLLEILCRMNAIVDKECSNQSVDVVRVFYYLVRKQGVEKSFLFWCHSVLFLLLMLLLDMCILAHK